MTGRQPPGDLAPIRNCPDHPELAEPLPEELVARIAQALRPLTEQGFPGLRNVSPENLEDARQMTWVEIAQMWRDGSLRPLTAPALARRVMHRKVIDTFRRRRREYLQDQLDDVPGQDEVDSVQQQEAVIAVRAAIGRLHPKHRNVIQLRYFRGKTFAEIAAAVGLSTPGAANRVAAAIAHLRQLLWHLEGQS